MVNCIEAKKLNVHIQGFAIIVYMGADFFDIYKILLDKRAKSL